MPRGRNRNDCSQAAPLPPGASPDQQRRWDCGPDRFRGRGRAALTVCSLGPQKQVYLRVVVGLDTVATAEPLIARGLRPGRRRRRGRAGRPMDPAPRPAPGVGAGGGRRHFTIRRRLSRTRRSASARGRAPGLIPVYAPELPAQDQHAGWPRRGRKTRPGRQPDPPVDATARRACRPGQTAHIRQGGPHGRLR